MTHMAADIAETGQTVYIRLMAEMNGHWNAYSAYNADGSARRHGHSARWYKLAWRRFTLILRGGSRDKINRRLVKMGLPRILQASRADDPVYAGRTGRHPAPDPRTDAPAAGGDDVGSAELRLAQHPRQPARRLLARRALRRLGRDRHLLEVRRARSTTASRFFHRYNNSRS